MRARGGVRRGFTRLSDRVGGAAAAIVFGSTIHKSQTVVVPKDGTYSIGVWGKGGDSSGSSGAASGGFSSKTVELAAGASIVISISDTQTQVTVAGFTLTAGGASSVTPGTATGGDVNIAGSAGVATGDGLAGGGNNGGVGGISSFANNGGGAGAPGNGPFRGGDGGASPISGPTIPIVAGRTPGAGGGEMSAAPNIGYGGLAQVSIIGVGAP